MTKDQLLNVLNGIPDDYEILIDEKRIYSYLIDKENKFFNLSSNIFRSFVFTYHPLPNLLQNMKLKNVV